jgi:hypothetical protein
MSSASAYIDRPAIEFLLSVLEAPKLEVSAVALRTFPIDVQEQLLASGFIRPSAFEPVASVGELGEDNPSALIWSAEHQSFGHFEGSVGWVSASHNDIRTYSLQLNAVFASLMGAPLSRYTSGVILTDTLWDVGSIQLSTSSKVAARFARRLFDPDRLAQVRQMMLSRPAEQRVILTSTTPDRLLDFPVGCAIVSIWDVLGKGFVAEVAAIGARLRGAPSDIHRELTLSLDGKVVTLYGDTFVFKKGVHQRAIVKFLYESYCEGQKWVPSAKIVEDLDLKGSARIRDYFKKNKAWNRLLRERHGLCGFCLKETS